MISIFILAFLILIISIVKAGDTMTVEANIFASEPEDIVRVEVQPYLNFGNVSIGEQSDEFNVQINNTGTTAVIVTPKLVNSSEVIFKNLYFREQKTKNGTAVPFSKLGKFSLNITKPDSSGVRKDSFWVKLDLRDFNGDLNDDMLNHKSKLVFVAMAQ